MAKQLAFFFDSASCSGCKACQAACKDKQDHEPGILWRRVYEITGGGWVQRNGLWEPNVLAYNLSVACNHCQTAPCLAACPTGAVIKRPDGIVQILKERCMGCRYCEWACPYSAPQYDAQAGKMTKCDFCADFLLEGKSPACVSACPLRALEFGQLEDLKLKQKDGARIFPLPPEEMAGPSLVIRPHRDSARMNMSGARARIANAEEVNHVE
jgi:anaerobic dimethyl sulfoxide reductase subunit B (iron-sulfur subunit)